VFAKQFMRRHRVPTADCEICEDAETARRVVRSGRFGFPLVVKADGLAAGKGVIIAPDAATALSAIDDVMVARQFGDAGDRLLLEECLQGPEVSVFVLADGTGATAFHTAQDHKRALDDDRGPNTGGMGAFAPSPLVDRALADRIRDEVIAPTIAGMRVEGRPFCGFLYAGLMLTPDGPKVLEFNARLGDPEAQVVLPMLDEDLAPLLLDAAAGQLNRSSCRFLDGARVGVVVASAGYPGDYAKGKVITGLDAATTDAGALVFHSGTTTRDGAVVTAGGRVLTVVGAGSDYRTAMSRAYDGVKKISFEGMRYRTDIGRKAIT
ncbi:MAG: phosphoribosylamine--glycine ligase, partial [Bacteroidales bacterium]